MAIQVGYAILAYVAARIAARLLLPKEKTPLIDEKVRTSVTRGTFSPLLIGRQKIGPFIAWTGDTEIETDNSEKGGKGAGGSDVKQTTYFESAVHVLCVGPAYRITKILINGKNLRIDEEEEINSTNFPSGSTVQTKYGTFEIYWGEPDQPTDAWASDPSRLGLLSKWPFSVRVNWHRFRLGGFQVWPTLEYVVECRPYGSTLSQSSDWLVGLGLNGTPHEILGVGHPPFTPYFKVFGAGGTDVRHLYPSGGYIQVSGQLADSLNRLFQITDSTYDSGEGHYQVDQDSFVEAGSGEYTGNLESWTIEADLAVVKDIDDDATNYPPGKTNSDGALYKIQESSNELGQTRKLYFTKGTKFSTGGQRLQFWVKGLGISDGWAEWCKIGFANSTFTKTASVQFSQSGGSVIYENETNEALVVEYTVIGEGWFKTVIEYNTDNGDDPLRVSDDRYIYIEIPTQGLVNEKIWVFYNDATETFLKLEPGTLRQGITTVFVSDILSHVVEDTGEIEGFEQGAENAPEGTNPAHAIEQLLFQTYPHGAGLDRNLFDEDSLEEIGIIGETEGARTHILLTNGDTFQAGVALILSEFHAYITWSYQKEKYVFGVLRDVSDETLLEIPGELIAIPPEVEQNHERRIANLIVYSFFNQHFAYRVDTIPIDDDAVAGLFNNRVTELVGIQTATDFFYAQQIAERKQLELLWPASATKLIGNRDVKMITPGRALTIEGEDETFRVTENSYDFESGETELNLVTDVFTIASSEDFPVTIDGNIPENVVVPEADLALTLWELPSTLSGGKVSIMPLRIRANTRSRNCALYASLDDSTYRLLGTDVPYATGGELTAALNPSTTILENGFNFSALGDDTTTLSQSLTTEDWLSGRQLLVIGTEVMYCKQIVALGRGYYRAEGVARARFGTSQGTYSAGTKLFVFPSSQLRQFSDLIITPGATLYIKTVPEDVDIEDALKTSRLIIGKGIRPQAPVAVRTQNSTNSFNSGEDVTVLWDYIHVEGALKRFGAGFQAAGETLEEPVSTPGMFRLTWRAGSATLRQVETSETSYTYDNADILSDLGSTIEEDLEVDIEFIYNGYRSDATTLAIEFLG